VSSAPAPQLDLQQNEPPVAALEPVTEAEPNVAANPLADEYKAVFHLTRTWVQYGVFGFAVLCIVIGAVEALFGR